MVVVNRCWLCKSDEESVDHLLLHCGAARALWNAFFDRFVFVELCLARLRSYWLVGGRAVVPRALLFGKWSLTVLCGVFGVSETIDVSRTPRDLLRNFSIFFFLPFSPRQRAGWPRG
jgi:hypothetical protein